MKEADVLVIGGGPAGLSAALSAGSAGAKVIICERDDALGGQLVKQTHKFFGNAAQYAGVRGFEIAKKLTEKVERKENIEVLTNATVQGFFRDDIVACEHKDSYIGIKPASIIIATGASEKFLAFEGNYLPGVYGAGAVQTLMNLYGVKPAEKVVMIGSGNIGLIVSYQLMQAGVEIAALVEAGPAVGGYEVHAAKLRRAGVPILTAHTVTKAYGDEHVEGVVISAVDEHFKAIPGTEEKLDCDCVCVSVGLQPLTELCWQNKCEMKNVSELGGYVPVTDENMRTSNPVVYTAGDASGVEEATAAMLEGEIAGCHAAMMLGFCNGEMKENIEEAKKSLKELRSGPTGAKVRKGLSKLRNEEEQRNC